MVLSFPNQANYRSVCSQEILAALQHGQRIEFCFGYPSWANTNPIDPGTLIVVTSGIEIICDRYELLKSLILRSNKKDEF